MPHNLIALQAERIAVPTGWKLNGKVTQGLLEPGSTMLRVTGDSASVWWNEPVKALFLTVEPAVIENARSQLNVKGSVTLASYFSRKDPILEHLMRALAAHLEGGCAAGRLFEESLLQTIALHLVSGSTANRPSDKRRSSLPPRTVTLIRAYIEDHLRSQFSVLDLANHVGFSPFYLNRMFRGATGRSLWKFVLDRRIEHSQTLIRTHADMSLTEIAFESGFETYGQFVAAFRNIAGLLPSEYQKYIRRSRS